MADSQAQYQSSIDLIVAGKPAPMVFNNKTGGGVTVNGSAETRRGRQLHPGDVILAQGVELRVVAGTG